MTGILSSFYLRKVKEMIKDEHVDVHQLIAGVNIMLRNWTKAIQLLLSKAASGVVKHPNQASPHG